MKRNCSSLERTRRGADQVLVLSVDDRAIQEVCRRFGKTQTGNQGRCAARTDSRAPRPRLPRPRRTGRPQPNRFSRGGALFRQHGGKKTQQGHRAKCSCAATPEHHGVARGCGAPRAWNRAPDARADRRGADKRGTAALRKRATGQRPRSIISACSTSRERRTRKPRGIVELRQTVSRPQSKHGNPGQSVSSAALPLRGFNSNGLRKALLDLPQRRSAAAILSPAAKGR